MATNVRCTAFFGSDDGWGWSETHTKAVGTEPTNLLPILQDFKSLIDQFRVPLLAKDRYVVGIRVAFGVRATGIRSSPFVYEPKKYPSNQREGAAPGIAAKLRMGEAGNQRFSDIYIRGFWDVVEQNEELDFSTAGGLAWKALLDQYIGALVSRQYGWLGTNEATTRRGKVTGYVPQTDGTILFNIVLESGPALPAANAVLPFRVAALNNSNSALNRSHIVKVVSPTSVVTVLPTAALPFVSQGTFVATATDFYQYTGLQYAKLARRAAGAPFFHSPGRAPARARG